jgi:hypothetical protein
VPAPSLALREFVAGEAVRLLMVEAIAGKIGCGFAEARPARWLRPGSSKKLTYRIRTTRTRPNVREPQLPATLPLMTNEQLCAPPGPDGSPPPVTGSHRAPYRHTDFMSRPNRIGKKTVHAFVTVEK